MITAIRKEPFHVCTVNAENPVEEVDQSEARLETIQAEKMAAVIAGVGANALSRLDKLHRQGLNIRQR